MSAGKLLLTGATGYLGRAFLSSLRPGDFSGVIGVLRDGTPPPNIAGVSWISYSDLINAPDSLNDVEMLCHLAVPRGGDNSTDLIQYVNDLRHLLSKAAGAGVAGFLFASSQAVYGASPPIWQEESPLQPVTAYGKAKLAGERLVLAAQGSGLRMRGISIRIPKLVGPGECFRMDQGEWVHSLVLAACLQRKIRLSASFLQQQIDFMDVRDAAKVSHFVLTQNTAAWPSALNIGTGCFVDGQGLAGAVDECGLKHFGKRLVYRIEPSMVRSRNFGMSVEALRRWMPGFAPKSLADTIFDVYAFVSNRKWDVCTKSSANDQGASV